MNLTDLLALIDLIFKKRQIRYALIGGYAVAAWGEERATRDVDFLCSVSDGEAITVALNEQGLSFEHRIGDLDDPVSEVIRIELGPISEPSEVDILLGIRDAPPGILDRARIVEIEGLAIPVASPEDMVILKLLGGSARDIEDARAIVEVQADRLHRDVMRSVCPPQVRDLLEWLIEA